MNVLLVVPWDNLGGVAHVVNRVAEHLRSRGHGVYYLLPGYNDTVEETVSRAGFPAFKLNLRIPVVPGRALRSRLAFSLKFPQSMLALAGLLRRLRIDVVNIHYPGGEALYFAALRRLGLVSVVTSIHGADLLLNGERAPSLPTGVMPLLGLSDLVITPSDSYALSVRQAFPELSLPLRTVPNGVDSEDLGYDPGAGDTTEDPPFIFSIAHLIKYKGVDVLIQAFAKICAGYPGLRLEIASDGRERRALEQLAEVLGIADRVRFLGFIGRDDVSRKLRGCICFVLPSRSNSESFGIAAAEAMALDRPVIGSRVGGLPELIENEVSGLLVPPGEVDPLASAMRSLLDDAALRRRLGTAGGERVRSRFPWHRTGRMYELLFSEVLASDVAAAEVVSAPQDAGRPGYAPARTDARGMAAHAAAPMSQAVTRKEEW